MVYAELIDYLADLCVEKSKKMELNQYTLGYLQAIRDIRSDLLEKFECEINKLADEN